ncbi:MAG: hypothetical protein HQL07_12580, partial [Nitrospirae bacterium]|nr:hypothetical protein [Magnetococcales bacterium]
MFQQILQLLNQPMTSWISGEVIFIWAFGQWLVWRLGILHPVRAKLADGIHLLTNLEVRDFSARLPYLDGEFARNELLAHPWRRYRQGVRISDAWVESRHDPEQFFSVDALLQGHMDLRFYRLLPYYLVGTGVLISLACFIAGLFFAPETLSPLDHSPLDAADMRNTPWEATGLFLKSFSYKLFPIFAGLLSGLLFSYGHRLQMDLLAAYARQFRRLLSERVQRERLESQESTSERMVEEIRSLVDPESMAQEIATHLDSTVSRILAAGNTEVVNTILARMASQAEVMGQQIEGVQSVVVLHGKTVVERQQNGFESLLKEMRGGFSDMATSHGILDGVREENRALMEKFKKHLATVRISLDPVLTALEEQGEKLVRQHREAIHEALDAVVVRGGTGGSLELQPLLLAMRTEGERLRVKNESNLKEILEQRLSPQVFMQTVREALGEFSGDWRQELSELRQTLEPLLTTFQVQGRQMAERHADIIRDTLSRALEEKAEPFVDWKVGLQPVLETLRTESQRIVQRQGEALHDALAGVVGPLRESFNADALVRSIRTDMSGFLEQLQERNHRQLESQMALSLSDLNVAGGDGTLQLEPMLAAIRVEGERVVSRQREAMNLAMEKMAGVFRESFSPGPIVEGIRQENRGMIRELRKDLQVAPISLDPIWNALSEMEERLTHHQARTIADAFREMADPSLEGRLGEIVETVRAEGRRILTEQGEVLGQVVRRVEEGFSTGFSTEKIIQAVVTEAEALAQRFEAQGGRLAQDIREIDVLATLRAEHESLVARIEKRLGQGEGTWRRLLEAAEAKNARLLEEHGASLKGLFDQVSPALTAGDERLSTVLTAVRQEGERILGRQGDNLRLAVEGVMDRFKDTLAPDVLVQAVQGEMRHLVGQMQQQGEALLRRQAQTVATALAGMETRLREEDPGLQTLLVDLRRDGDRLLKRQEEILNGALSGIWTGESMREALRVEHDRLGVRIREDLAQVKVSLTPLLEALENHGERLVREQARAIGDAFANIAVRSETGHMQLEPVLVAIKAEGERMLARQEALVERALDKRFDRMALEEMIRGTQADLFRRFETMVAVREERLGPVIQGLQGQGEAMAAQLGAALEGIVASLERRGGGMESRLTELLRVVKGEGERIVSQQGETIRLALEGVTLGFKEMLSPQGVMQALRSELAPVARRLEEQGSRLAQSHCEAIDRAVAVLKTDLGAEGGQHLERLTGEVRRQGEEIVAKQRQHLERLLADGVIGGTAPTWESGVVESLEGRIQDALASGDHLLHRVLESVVTLEKTLMERQAGVIVESLRSGGVATLEPVLAAVRAEGERVLSGMAERFSLESLLEGIRGEWDGLVVRLTEGMDRDEPVLEPVLAAFKVQAAQLAVQHEAIQESLRGFQDGHKVLETGLQEISQGHGTLLHTIMAAFETQGRDLARSHAKAMAEALEAVAFRGDDGTTRLEPVLVAVKAEGERILSRQGELVRV